MRINRVKIKKFRSIGAADVRINDITAIVGENNAGKTAILRAINCVLNYKEEEKYFANQTHRYDSRSNSYITIEFEIKEVLKGLKKYTDNGYLTLQLVYEYSKKTERFSYKKKGKFIKMKDKEVEFFFDIVNSHLNYFYISAERTNQELSWNNNSIFYQLIIEYLDKHTSNRDTLSTNIIKASKDIKNKVLKNLEKDLKNNYLIDKSINFDIKFSGDLDYTAILKYLLLNAYQNEDSKLLQEWGSGTKSLAIISMYRVIANLNNKKIVFGIEEPETNLHPHAQKKFVKNLRSNMSKNEIQTIFTTHSTVLVDELNHEDIIAVKRAKDDYGRREFVSSIHQLPQDFVSKYNLVDRKYYHFYKDTLRNSEFFFSRYVIVCESANDKMIIEELLKTKRDEMIDVSIVCLDGVDNYSYIYFLLKELSIPFSTVVDYDFFFDYLNDDLDKSRNKYGYPQYKKTITAKANKIIIEDLFCGKISELERQRSYSSFFSYVSKKSIYPMKYCLEIDLVTSKEAREEYYKILKINESNRNEHHLLVDNKKGLKKRDHLFRVISNIKNYPTSYIKIKNSLLKDLKNYK